jgi:hypothetical protein
MNERWWFIHTNHEDTNEEDFIMSKKDQTPSNQVDQKALLNDKVQKARENNFEGDHIRQTSPGGVPRQ